MAGSSEFKSLSREVNRLRKHFLPEVFDPLGSYSNSEEVQAHTRAFLVFCHAEIESFLEWWAKTIARKAELLWVNKRRVSAPLAHLVAASMNRLIVSETSSNDPPSTRFEACANSSFHQFYLKIKRNNGVKEPNCLQLFGALGIDASAFGATLLPSLDSLGQDRGEHAHHAARLIVTPLDPEIEFKRISDVLIELANFDAHLVGVRRTLR